MISRLEAVRAAVDGGDDVAFAQAGAGARTVGVDVGDDQSLRTLKP